MPNLADKMKNYGLNVYPVKGWESHARPYTFKPEGVMIHHTAGANSLNIVRNGRSGLPGPLSQFLISKSGRIYLISQGYCNHAGTGNKSVLARTRENLPPTGRARSRGDINGNRYYWGIEVENLGNGSDPYPPEQIRALEALCAFLCEEYGWSFNRIVHHKEWTSRKIDMSYNGDVRANVEAIMLGKKPKSVSVSCENDVFQTGDKGSCVEKLQRLLNSRGASLTADGDFGPKTEAAVKEFQQSRQLTVDGIVGPKTWGELNTTTKATVTAKEYPLLRSGSIDDSVNTVRSLLLAIGYPVVEKGGLFDRELKAEVEKFQRRQGLSVDGIVGPNTWSELLKVAKSKAEASVTVSSKTNHEEQILELGDKGASVKYLQERLLELDFEITVDGDFGPKTDATVKHSQEVFRIDVDGVVGPATWGAYRKGYALDKVAVFRGQASQVLAMLIGKKWGIPAVSYLDKRPARRAVLVGQARSAAGRYTEYRSITGTLDEQVQKVYDEIV